MYMLLSRHQNTEQNHDIKIGNRSFKNVARFKYLGTSVTNQNLIQKEFKRRLNLENTCYHSDRNMLSSSLLSKNVKIIIFHVVLNTCEIWFPTLRVLGNRVLRRIFRPNRAEMAGGWRKRHN
jgi:hypothetical protein